MFITHDVSDRSFFQLPRVARRSFQVSESHRVPSFASLACACDLPFRGSCLCADSSRLILAMLKEKMMSFLGGSKRIS